LHTSTSPGDRITPRKLGGTLLAFFGVVALFGESLQLDLTRLGPMAAIIVAALCAAAAGVASKRHGSALHAAALNAPAMLAGGHRARRRGDSSPERTAGADRCDDLGSDRLSGDRRSVVTFLIYFSLLKTWTVTSLSFISVFTP
jgi:hypothetical protein